jgi:hypothetical protein
VYAFHATPLVTSAYQIPTAASAITRHTLCNYKIYNSAYVYSLVRHLTVYLQRRDSMPMQFITRQAMFVYRNIQTRSCNHCCSVKATRLTYSECVSVALGIQHEMRMGHIAIYGLTGSTIFFHTVSQTARFSEKRFMNIKRAFLFSLQSFSEKNLILRRKERDTIINVYLSSCKDLVIIVKF